MATLIKTDLAVLDRGFYILDLLSDEQPLTGTQLRDRTGLSRSTLYRFLSALSTHGYIEKNEKGGYCLGHKLITLASSYINELDLVTMAQPLLWKLSGELNLTVYLAILYHTDIVTVACADVVRRQSVHTEIGLHMSAIRTAMGKCLLSNLSGKDLDLLFHNNGSPFGANSSMASPKVRNQILHDIRENGYVIDKGEFDPALRCVAAPVYNYRNEIEAAICACGSRQQLPLDRCHSITSNVVSCANELSHRLGYA